MNLDQLVEISSFYYGIFCVLIMLYTIVRVQSGGERYMTSYKPQNGLMIGMAVLLILIFTFFVGADKFGYRDAFKYACNYGLIDQGYAGWNYLTLVISKITNNENIYFSIIAFIYVSVNLWFCKKQTNNYFVLFIAVITFMGYYAYGVNTIKGGIGLSMCLVAYYYCDKDRKIALLFAVLAFFIHKSTLLPLAAFIVARYLKISLKYYYAIWIMCLMLSYSLGDYFNLYFGDYLSDREDIFARYLLEDTDRYKVGFRIDFVIYSLITIIWGYYVSYINKHRYNNVLWNTYFKAYLLANAFWLLIISMPFTDRVAYLSWFLMPYTLFIPLLDKEFQCRERNLYATLFFVIISGFNIYLLMR